MAPARRKSGALSLFAVFAVSNAIDGFDSQAIEQRWRIMLDEARYLTGETSSSYSYSYDESCQNYELVMEDSYGNGWKNDGNFLSIVNFFTGETIYSGLTVKTSQGYAASETVCLPIDTCFKITVSSGGGEGDADVSWSLNNVHGVVGTFDMCTYNLECEYDMTNEFTVLVPSSHQLSCALSNLTYSLSNDGETEMVVALTGAGPYVRSLTHYVTRALDLMIVGGDSRPTLTAGGATTLFAVEKGSTLTLDGVSLSGGYSTGYGGAILAVDATVILLNVTVHDCHAAHEGGGVFGLRSDFYFFDSLIANNTAGTNGGGVGLSGFNTDLDASNYFVEGSRLICTRCTLVANVAATDGGAAAAFTQSTIELIASTAVLNYGGQYGGFAYAETNAALSIESSIVSENGAGTDGGAAYVNNNAKFTARDSVIVKNSASYQGGALVIYMASAALDNVKVANNTCVSGAGTAIYANKATIWAHQSTFLGACNASECSGSHSVIDARGSSAVAELTLDTCTIEAGHRDARTVASEGDIILRNTDLEGSMSRLKLTYNASIVGCAQLDDYPDTACSAVYCADSATSAGVEYDDDVPSHDLGISCYCQTYYGTFDPTYDGCVNPPLIDVPVRSFPGTTPKPDALVHVMFFVNNGDIDLEWGVDLLDDPDAIGASWTVTPTSGTLAPCALGNVTFTLVPTDLEANKPFSNSFKMTSNCVKEPVISLNMVSTVTAAPLAGLSRHLTRFDNSSFSVTAMNDSLSGTAGSQLITYIEPHDVDDMWIRRGGNEDFSAVVVGVCDGCADRRVVCETTFMTGVDLYQIVCDLADYEAGAFELELLLDDAFSVSNSPFALEVGCPAGFTELNNRCQCGPGLYLDRAAKECTPCPPSTWSGRTMMDGVSACQDCKEHIKGSITLDTGTPHWEMCQCTPGYYEKQHGNQTYAAESAFDDDTTVAACTDCPSGTDCSDYGLAVHSMIIKQAFWRTSNLSHNVLPCPYAEFCIGSVNGTMNDLCHAGHHGPYCSICEKDFYREVGSVCTKCEALDVPGVITGLVLGVVVVILVIVVGLAIQYKMDKNAKEDEAQKQEKIKALDAKVRDGSASQSDIEELNGKPKTKTDNMMEVAEKRGGVIAGRAAEVGMIVNAASQNMDQIQGAGADAGSMANDAQSAMSGVSALFDGLKDVRIGAPFKIAIAGLQVNVNLENVFSIPNPPNLSKMFANLSVVQLDVAALVPMACLFDGGFNFHKKLIFNTLWPIAFAGCIIGMCGLADAFPDKFPILKSLRSTIFVIFLTFTFVIYPTASNTIFNTFNCESFDDGFTGLKTDFSIDCTSSEHKSFVLYAIFMVLVYPIGIPVMYIVTMYLQHPRLTLKHEDYAELDHETAIEKRDKDLNLKHVHFLYYQYRPEHWYFEVLECIRKMFLTGIMMFVMQNSATQLAIGIFISFLSFGAFAYIEPFLDPNDSWMQMCAQFATFLVLLTGLLFKMEVMGAPGEIPEDYAIAIMYTVVVFPICVAIYIVAYDIKSVRDDLKELAEEVPELTDAARKWSDAATKMRHSMLLASPSKASASASYQPSDDVKENTASEVTAKSAITAFGAKNIAKVAPAPSPDDT